MGAGNDFSRNALDRKRSGHSRRDQQIVDLFDRSYNLYDAFPAPQTVRMPNKFTHIYLKILSLIIKMTKNQAR